MKKFVRYILIGVCVLSGYGLVEASGQVDTIDACYQPGESLKAGIIEEKFSKFQDDDRRAIRKNAKSKIDSIDYRNYQLEFTGEGITNKKICNDFDSYICPATSGYRDQIIYCTISYIREIRFKNPKIDESYYDSEKAIQKDDLLGDSTSEYPQLSLTSKRELPVVIRIKKNVNLQNKEFFIECKDTCLKDKLILKVPEEYADMRCSWSCDRTHIDMSNEVAPEITISRKDTAFLTTNVQCTIYGCNNAGTKPSSIRIRSYYTPTSTITVDIAEGDCLSTLATEGTIPITVSNEFAGVTFEWDPILEYNISKTDSRTQTIIYPVPAFKDFTIGVTTSGGCTTSHASKTVHRKLDNNIDLKVLDSSPSTGIQTQFTIETVPSLPNMSLQWAIPLDFQPYFPDKSREDKIIIYKVGTLKSSVEIGLRNRHCPSGYIPKEITVK